jgi:TonB-dependent receptor
VFARRRGAAGHKRGGERNQEKRIPGISIARDQGEGRYILIRGTEPRLNSVLINGERIPAPENGTRQIQLDAVPADQLQAIQVSKALTPDMDADAIGGAVNLITRQASSRPTALFSIGGGYNSLQRTANQQQYSGTYGRRTNDGRLGLLVGGSASILNRGSENFEPEYDDGFLANMELRDYQIRRERYGLNLTGDYRANDNTAFVVRGIFNDFQDYEVNNRIIFSPEDERIEHYLKNRNQSDYIRSVSGSGQHLFGQTTLDYRLAWSESSEKQPDRLDTVFRQDDIAFDPNVSPDFIDPENIQPNPSSNNPAIAELDSWETAIFDTKDRDLTGALDLRLPLRTSAQTASFLKVGFKVRDKRKTNALSVTSAEPEDDVLFPELQDTGFDNSRFLEFFPAGYDPFPGIDADRSRDMFGALPAGSEEVDHEADAEDYDAKERIVAGYAMVEWFVNDRLLVLPGVRFESTKVDYTGYDVIYDADGDYVSTDPLTGGDTYGSFLPGVHVRYAIDPDTNIRAAYTRTLARPNYVDLVPYQVVIQEDEEIARGNPLLKPTMSNNVDIMAERYFRSVGIVSAGFFYKHLSDYIYFFRFDEDFQGDEYEVTQPQNGESASLWGLELAFQNQLRFLPSPFDGIGVYANYTLTDSSAEFPDRDGSSTLPGQSRHVGNVAVSYEKAGFLGRASWNFHGKYIEEVGGDAAEDVFYDNHTQLDLNFAQQLNRRLRVYADFLNLTNAPLRYFEGTTDRPIQEEYYKGWMAFGLKLTM